MLRNTPRLFAIGLLAYFSMQCTAAAQDHNMEQVFKSAQHDHYHFARFIDAMPKGGDLHNHLWGASYPENMLAYAYKDKLCVNEQTFALSSKLPCSQAYPLAMVVKDHHLVDRTIQAWSLWHFKPTAAESKHDHFFSVFAKTAPLIDKYRGTMVHEVAERAGRERENYLELMITNDNANAMDLAQKLPFTANYAQDRQQLLQNGLLDIVKDIRQQINSMDQTQQRLGGCQGSDPDASCGVTIRYQYLAIRVLPKPDVFAQLLTGFELAKRDPRVVGINLVGPEDNVTALSDYKDHMQMLAYLHQQYPQVKIDLHAGELAANQVSPADRSYHINAAIHTAHADRIGHGVDILAEKGANKLLDYMAKQHIPVEINLTSNAKLLGIKGKAHPLPQYLKHHVPVVLSTDDEGILRTYLNREYRLAVQRYNLSYSQLKLIDRNSLSYSFLPGNSLWQDPEAAQPVSACAKDTLGAQTPSHSCQQFLAHSEKAQIQWRLEGQLNRFEQEWLRKA